MQNKDTPAPNVKKEYRRVAIQVASKTEKSAKSKLYEICASRRWKPPSFESYFEEGPIHKRQFAYKVTVAVEESAPWKLTSLECYGEPMPLKKKAADHAAEGALWYLKRLGYVPED